MLLLKNKEIKTNENCLNLEMRYTFWFSCWVRFHKLGGMFFLKAAENVL